MTHTHSMTLIHRHTHHVTLSNNINPQAEVTQMSQTGLTRINIDHQGAVYLKSPYEGALDSVHGRDALIHQSDITHLMCVNIYIYIHTPDMKKERKTTFTSQIAFSISVITGRSRACARTHTMSKHHKCRDLKSPYLPAVCHCMSVSLTFCLFCCCCCCRKTLRTRTLQSLAPRTPAVTSHTGRYHGGGMGMGWAR